VTSALLAALDERGLIHNSTDRGALGATLDGGTQSLYCGFDPTADSLHLGNLAAILMLRRFQDAGHRPIALAGGATGMVGDPGGRSDERNLLDRETLEANTAAISGQLERLLDFSSDRNGALLVNNADWTAPIGVLDFLRDVGKHITVNSMLARDSVRSRIESEHGISFTEFSYMLLQAHDYLVLHERHGCVLQVAGSDQWGNITAGIELIRKRLGVAVHGLTAPLVTKSDGTKYGKSVSGALWLDAAKTSPYALYQFLFNSDDADVDVLLRMLTLVPLDEVRSVLADHAGAPGLRGAQRLLARSVVELVHGAAGIPLIEAAQRLLFGGGLDWETAEPEAFEILAEELPTTELPEDPAAWDEDLAALMVRAGLAASKGEVRKNIAGFKLNGAPITADQRVQASDLAHGRFALLKKGRTGYHLLCAGKQAV
jgi:tyrosyl-tRNA synthetase